MTEQEIELCLKRLATCKTTDVMNFDYAGTLAYIERLKAENAALRERTMPQMTERHYRPKEWFIVEQWLKDNEGTPGVQNFKGVMCYYNINRDTFEWIRHLCLCDKLWFTRQKEHEYVGHTDDDEQLWYIHDDLMEEKK